MLELEGYAQELAGIRKSILAAGKRCISTI